MPSKEPAVPVAAFGAQTECGLAGGGGVGLGTGIIGMGGGSGGAGGCGWAGGGGSEEATEGGLERRSTSWAAEGGRICGVQRRWLRGRRGRRRWVRVYV